MKTQIAAIRNNATATAATICTAAAVALCWMPVIGSANAIAGVILSWQAKRSAASPILPRITLIASAAALIASVIFLTAALTSPQTVSSYDASPWT